VTISRRVRLLLIAPAVVALVLSFVLPMLSDLRLSLSGYDDIMGVQDTVTLDQYQAIFQDSTYLDAWLLTLRIAILSGLLTTLLGALISFGLWRLGGRTRSVVSTVVIAPLLVSGVVRAYGWIAVMGPAGLLPQLTGKLGLGEVTILYNEPAMVIGFVHALLPYAILILLASFDRIDPTLLRAAANIGARPAQAVRLVVLPLVYPGIFASVLLTFVMASAAYAVPAILGGARQVTAATAIFQEQNVYLNWPAAAALALSLAVGTLLIMVAYQALTRRTTSRVEGHA